LAHIIIVEEEPALLRLFIRVTQTLCSPLTQISGVSNGQQALEVHEESQADLIISDCRMRVMDGLQLIRTLRSRGVTIPMVITSGNPFVAAQAYEAGATVFVEKMKLIGHLPAILDDYLPP
jgi:CheY-like chemotaxis protein